MTENTDGTVNIELGEDETGSLVALQIAERGNLGNQAGEVDYSVNLDLLPEGAEFPETREEGAGFGNVETYSYLNEITDDLGMQLEGSWDLGSSGSNEEDFNNGDGPMRIWDARLPSPEFISDTPISSHDIEVDEIVEGITPIDRPDLLVDGHVGVVSIQPNDYSTAFLSSGSSFDGTAGNDTIGVNAYDEDGLRITPGAGEDQITIGPPSSFVDASGDGVADTVALQVTDNHSFDSTSLAPSVSAGNSDTIEIEFPEDTDGQLIAIHSRTDTTDESPPRGDREDWNIEVFLVSDGLEIPEQVDGYADILALIQGKSLGLANIHLGEFNALKPTSLGMDYDSTFSPELVTDRGISHVVVTTQIG